MLLDCCVIVLLLLCLGCCDVVLMCLLLCVDVVLLCGFLVLLGRCVVCYALLYCSVGSVGLLFGVVDVLLYWWFAVLRFC